MLRFVGVNKSNYFRFEKYLVSNEKFFNPKLRTPKEEYRKVIDDVSQVTFLLFNNNFVGHVSGFAVDDKVFYVFSVLVKPKFRGMGYSKLLFKKFLSVLKVKGYRYLEGHFNKLSINLVKDFRVVKEKRFYKNYRYVRVKL